VARDPFHFDYQRHLAARDLLPQHQEDFQRLVKLLSHAPGFQLFFARVADPGYRDVLIAKLGKLMALQGRPVRLADLGDERRFPDFQALEAWLEEDEQKSSLIHLINGSAWLQGSRLHSLNLRRNALAEKLEAALLWWLSVPAIEHLAQQAPDAWSWRSGVFDFVDPGAQLPSRPEEWMPAPLSLNLPQRSQRLAVLNRQLAAEFATEIPDEFRLNLLLERADLLESLGLWAEAEQGLRQEALPLAERLGDVRSKAVTMGQIADILQAHGQLDEALRIRQEEELPVYERLGDVREKAVSMAKIASMLRLRGQLDEALSLLKEEVLPAFGQLGVLREKTLTMGKIADILQARGQLDEALRIRQEEQLPVYERLGDVREKAVTMGNIADILQARGQLDEALALHEECLPIAQWLGDIEVIAFLKYSRARIRLQRGDHQRGGLPEIYADLAAAHAIGVKLRRPDYLGTIGLLLAQVMSMTGEVEEALRILDQAEAAFNQLGWTADVAAVREMREAISAQTGPG